jgi:N-acetylneuraminate synthase
MSEPANRAVEVVAEIAQAHDGSLGTAHAYIDALAGTGVDTVKFQVHIAAAESSVHEPFRVQFSFEDETRYAYWQRMEFTPEQWAGLKLHCEQHGLEFLASPFSIAAVELLERLGVARYKIGSGETSNLLMLDRIARTGKPIILSSGLSTFDDLDRTIAFLRPHRNALTLLQCTTSYPTAPAQVGLNVLAELRGRYGLPVGLSDHSGTIHPGLAAVALGARMLEFHAVFDRRAFGPDATSSLQIDEIRQLVEGVRAISTALAHPIDKSTLAVAPELLTMFGKSLSVNRDLAAGSVLELAHLESRKPGDRGISAQDFRDVVGRKLARALQDGDFLTADDLSPEDNAAGPA